LVTPFEDGVIQYLATNGNIVPAKNPHTTGEVVAAMSSIYSAEYSDSPSHLVEQPHDGRTGNCTKNKANSWVSLDLGEGRSLVPNYYCARHGNNSGNCRLQSWDFEGSNDGSNYTVFRSHKNDSSLPNKAFSVAAWKVEGVNQAYRYFRIRMTGKNSGTNSIGYNHPPNHCLWCAGIELYGMLLTPTPPTPQHTHPPPPLRTAGHECVFDAPFGNNGVIYYIVTVGKTKPYKISSSSGVTPKMSSMFNCEDGPAHLLFHKHDGSTYNRTKNGENSWVSIDLGEGRSLIVNYYCLRHGTNNGNCRLQSWDFEGSNDGSEWTVLRVHKDDNSLPNEAFSEAAWEVEGVNQAYRHFRIRQTGKNSGANNANHVDHYLFCAGIELWGRLLSK
jgi:osmotically-inducible protein OsmY